MEESFVISVPLNKCIAEIKLPVNYSQADLEKIIKVIKAYFPDDKFYKEKQ